MQTKLIIADDHPFLLQGIEHHLKFKGYHIVDTAFDGNSAYNTILKNKPEIAILDFNMPKLNGLEIAQLCCKNVSQIKLIILTLHKEEAILQEVGKSIHGYILKEDALEEVDLCISAVKKGNIYISKKIKEEVYLGNTNNNIGQLTPAELKILRFLAKDWSSSKIAEHLFISKRTVEKHRSNIIRKLGLKSTQNSLLLWIQQHPEILSS